MACRQEGRLEGPLPKVGGDGVKEVRREVKNH
jgi:hypothetical protein